ncbi:hypothetical protein ACFWR9_11115 [Streptomyces sp. NPDC058534]|uniref:hypothetical protein n=1 Tax=Streptomyces sp. NPDC058534 TaxID=3346541 RepID=UPI00364E4634
MPQPPSPGRTVMYRLSEDDARHIAHQRVQSGLTGNYVEAGQQYPAVVIRVRSGSPDDAVNLRVLLDGQDPPVWATSRLPGDQPGTWSWPERV